MKYIFVHQNVFISDKDISIAVPVLYLAVLLAIMNLLGIRSIGKSYTNGGRNDKIHLNVGKPIQCIYHRMGLKIKDKVVDYLLIL